MARPLGKVQKQVLKSLQEHGRWLDHRGLAGWVWDTYTNTKRIMDSLVKRGLASREGDTYYPKETQEMTEASKVETLRKDVLLRAAYDLLTRAEEGPYVQEAASIRVQYDGAPCGGACLRDDLADILGLEPDTPPIPLEEDDD